LVELRVQLHANLLLGKGPSTHWIGGSMDPRADLDAYRREEFLAAVSNLATIP
jgi:hypothetical protein